MAYARFGAKSDVYVFLSISGHLECCGCRLGDQWVFGSTDEMLEHLEEHKAAGHCVPQHCIDRLLEKKDENDEWIDNFSPIEEMRKNREANQRIDDIRKIMADKLDYVHPGPELFDVKVHQEHWDRATEIYEERQKNKSTGTGEEIA